MFETEDSVHKSIRTQQYELALLRVLITQWIERPLGVRKVVGSNPVMASEFFLSIIDLKRRHCVAVVIYLFISKHFPNLLLFTIHVC